VQVLINGFSSVLSSMSSAVDVAILARPNRSDPESERDATVYRAAIVLLHGPRSLKPNIPPPPRSLTGYTFDRNAERGTNTNLAAV